MHPGRVKPRLDLPPITGRCSLFLLLLCLFAGGLISVHLQQDANWDLQNYHLYNAFAFLGRRLHLDLFSAGTQTYFNPLLDVPYYILSTFYLFHHPQLLAFVMGLPYGALLFLTIQLAAEVLPVAKWEASTSRAVAILAAIYGCTGFATFAEIGTTFNDIPTAAMAVGAMLLIVRSIGRSSRPRFLMVLAAGAIFGIAAGLKLTMLIFAPGAAISVLFMEASLKERLKLGAVFCVAWIFGLAISWGWWGISIYRMTGNPLFPLLNDIFHSSWIGAGAGMDTRFMPRSWPQAFFYPFFWRYSSGPLVAELPFSDARFGIAYASCFFLLLQSAWKRLFFLFGGPKGTATEQAQPRNRKLYSLLSFSIISYAVWEAIFSIIRYAVPIEAISGIFVFSAIGIIGNIAPARVARVLPPSAGLGVIFAVALTARFPAHLWGRIPYGATTFSYSKVNVPPGSLIIFFSKPVAYTAPLLSRNIAGLRFIGLTPTALWSSQDQLGEVIRSRLDQSRGAAFGALLPAQAKYANQVASVYHLRIRWNDCQPFFSNLGPPLQICSLQRRARQQVHRGQ